MAKKHLNPTPTAATAPQTYASQGEVGGGVVMGAGEPAGTTETTTLAQGSDDSQESVDSGETDAAAVAGANSPFVKTARWNQLLLDVGKLGRDQGDGKKAIVALAERIVEAASAGVVGTDNAEQIYKRFRDEANRRSGNTVPKEQDDNSFKSQVAKMKNLILIGQGLHEQAWPVLEMARDMHVSAMQSEDKNNLKVKSTYEAILSVCRAQLDDAVKGVPLTEEAIADILFKSEATEEKTGYDLLNDAYVAMEKAREGKEAKADKPGRAPVWDDYLQVTHDNLGDWLRANHPSFAANEAKAAEEAARKAQTAEEKAAIKAEEKAAKDAVKAEEKRLKAEAKAVAKAAAKPAVVGKSAPGHASAP